MSHQLKLVALLAPFVLIHNPSMAKSPEGMEQCRVTNKDRTVGLIKAGQADGIGSIGIGNQHKGLNIEGELNAYIWVPEGMCRLIKEGKITEVPKEILDKIHLDGLPGVEAEVQAEEEAEKEE